MIWLPSFWKVQSSKAAMGVPVTPPRALRTTQSHVHSCLTLRGVAGAKVCIAPRTLSPPVAFLEHLLSGFRLWKGPLSKLPKWVGRDTGGTVSLNAGGEEQFIFQGQDASSAVKKNKTPGNRSQGGCRLREGGRDSERSEGSKDPSGTSFPEQPPLKPQKELIFLKKYSVLYL